MTVREVIEQRNMQWYDYVVFEDWGGQVQRISEEILNREVEKIEHVQGVFVPVTYIYTK